MRIVTRNIRVQLNYFLRSFAVSDLRVTADDCRNYQNIEEKI